MDAGAWAVTAVMVAGGVSIGAMALMSARGTLPRNGFAGIRVPSTMASDEAWAAGHRAAVPWLWACAALFVAGAVGAFTTALAGWGNGVFTAFVLGGLLLATVVILVGTVVASRAATAVSRRQEAQGRDDR